MEGSSLTKFFPIIPTIGIRIDGLPLVLREVPTRCTGLRAAAAFPPRRHQYRYLRHPFLVLIPQGESFLLSPKYLTLMMMRLLLVLLAAGVALAFKTWVQKALVAGIVASNIHVSPAHAFSLFPSAEQSTVNTIASFQKPVNELYDNLRPSEVPNPIGVYATQQILKGGVEDSNVVKTYEEVHIKPLQNAMEKSLNVIKLKNDEQQKRLEILPQLMKGHILELDQAIASLSAKEQEKEVEEIVETLNEYLNLVKNQYEVEMFQPAKAISDKDLFGPLGCGFYGKQRVPGSNACVEK